MDFNSGEVTIHRRLQVLAQEEPERPAFIFWDKNLQRTVFTRQEIWDKSRKCAAFLRRQGVMKGDVVCNTLVNSQERLITTYGVILAGAVLQHGQKFLADGTDIVNNLQGSRCRAILINPDEEKGPVGVLEKIKYTDNKTGNICYEGLPCLSHVIYVTLGNKNNSTGLLQLLENESNFYVDDKVTEDDIAMILTTSGSTGFAKLVPHTHRTLAAIGENFYKLFHMKDDSVFFNDRSLGWIAGTPVAYNQKGVARVLVDLGPGNGKVEDLGSLIVHILEYEKCDTALILPSTTQAVLDHLDSVEKHKLNTLLHAMITGGGPVSRITMGAIGRITEIVANVYGATEFGAICGLDVTEESKSTFENACIGYPAEFVDTKIVDENLRELPLGKSGELLIRAPTLTSGYLDNEQINKQVRLADGWWRTSDIGHINQKGQLFVYCRKSFAINHKGFTHYPGWMETRIDRHPDIQKSIVIGIPDPVDIEQICLCIVKFPESTLSAEEVHEYCKSLFLTTEKEDITPMPKYYLFFESFQLSSVGKIDRKAVKQVALNRLANHDI